MASNHHRAIIGSQTKLSLEISLGDPFHPRLNIIWRKPETVFEGLHATQVGQPR
jgi:hypothetical protein